MEPRHPPQSRGLGGGAPTCRMATEMKETEVRVTRALSSQSWARSCLYLGGHGALGGAMTEMPREPSQSGRTSFPPPELPLPPSPSPIPYFPLLQCLKGPRKIVGEQVRTRSWK